jgi:CheY-like chemotaxis protein/prolyl-tRNA editing enzyme YbaK/EbsC (Cys-tRNA(Pro) deacylase)
MAVPQWLKGLLSHYDVPFEEHSHPPVYSASRLAHVEHVSGHRVAKTVFLAADNQPVAVVLPASARVDPRRVQAVLGAKELRFAAEEEIARWFRGCHLGGVPPLRLRSDERILMDRSLAHFGKMIFCAGSPEVAIFVRFRDWYRMVHPGVGRFTLSDNGPAAAQTPPTVLVVEDEADTNLVLCRLLEREGFASRGAEDGTHALAMASEVRPSAILLDLMLPDMSGFDMYERLRQVGPLKRTPVVIVSALDDEVSRQRGRELGAEAYLTKPFEMASLLRELQGILADERA